MNDIHQTAHGIIQNSMKGSSGTPGFTIIEVLIVLGITAMLFFAAALMIAGRQNRTAFVTSIQDFQTQMQQVANDVIDGSYYNYTNFSCSQNGTPPNGQPILSYPAVSSPGNGGLTSGSDSLQGCAFLGKAIQFAVGSSSSPLIDVYPVVGNLETQNAQPTQGLDSSYPVLLAQSGPGTQNANFATSEYIAQYDLKYGLTVAWACYSMSSSSPCDGTNYNLASDQHYATGMVVFATNQSNSGSGANLSFGAQELTFAPIPGSYLGQSTIDAVDTANSYLSYPDYPAPKDPSGYNGLIINPPGGVFVCVADPTTDQSGLLTVGGNNRSAVISLSVQEGSTNCT